MGNDRDTILRYITEQYPGLSVDNPVDRALIIMEMLREISDCYVSTFGRMQELTAALDRINTRLKDNLNALKPRHISDSYRKKGLPSR